MRRYFSYCLLIIIASLAACNNNSNNPSNASNSPATTSPTLPIREQELRDSVTKYPDSAMLKENLIEYYRENGNYEQAIAATKDAIKKDSISARLRDIEGTLYFENNDTVHSIQAFEKAVSLNPNPEYLMSLGSLYAETKNPLALSVADKLLKDPQANAGKQALFIKGLYYSYAGDKQKAIGFFDTCLSMDYTDMFSYREKAICLYDMGKYKEALSVLEKATEVENTYDEAYYWRGRCYEKLGNKNAAIQNYQTALQIDKDYTEAKDALAKLGVSGN